MIYNYESDCCCYPILTPLDMDRLTFKWKIDDLIESGNKEEAVRLLLENRNRNLKYPALYYEYWR